MNNEQIREILEQLWRDNGGVKSAQALVDAAEAPTHPLHYRFPWDDRTLANARRLEIARSIISSTEITITTPNRTIVTLAYVRDPHAGPRVQSYAATVDVINIKEDSRLVLLNELAAIESRIARAIKLAAALNPVIVASLEGLLKALNLIRAKINKIHRPKSKSVKKTVPV